MAQMYSGQPERSIGTSPVPVESTVHPLIQMYRDKNSEFAEKLHTLEQSRVPGVWITLIEILIAQDMEEIFLYIQDGRDDEVDAKIAALQVAAGQLQHSEYASYGDSLESLVRHIAHLAKTYRAPHAQAA